MGLQNATPVKKNLRQTPPDAFAKKETSQSRQTGNDPRRGFNQEFEQHSNRGSLEC